jgi:hypothetical protein
MSLPPLFIFDKYFFAGIILFVFYHPLKNKRIKEREREDCLNPSLSH